MLSVRDEMTAYLKKLEKGTDNPLSFWKNKGATYPTLAKYARIILGIPGAATPSESLECQWVHSVTQKGNFVIRECKKLSVSS